MHDDSAARARYSRSVTLLVPGDLNMRTGGYGYDREIVTGLRALGWEVNVASLDGSFPHPTADARVQAARALAALPDGALVLADGLAFGAMAAEAEREAHRLTLVGLVHHLLADETGLDDDAVRAFAASERRALASTRGVVVTSAATADRVTTYGVDAGRISVVMPGTAPAPLARGTRGVTSSDAAVSVPGLAPVSSQAERAVLPVDLLCVATLVPRKGHDVLIAALARLRHLPWHLTCAGSLVLHPPTAAALRDRVRVSGLEDRVTFAGDLDAIRLARAYDHADVFVLPTRHEGYGMAVAEAVARGLPVVSTATGAIADLVDASSGAIVPIDDVAALADALEPLIADGAALARVAAGARARRDSLPRWSDSAQAMADALTRFAAYGIVQR